LFVCSSQQNWVPSKDFTGFLEGGSGDFAFMICLGPTGCQPAATKVIKRGEDLENLIIFAESLKALLSSRSIMVYG